MKPIIVVFLLFCLLLSCVRCTAPVEGLSSLPSTKTQVQIAWPGLADSPWPTFLHDPQHTGRSQYRGPHFGIVEWTFETNNYIYSSPVIGPDGSVYFQCHDQYMYAITSAGGLKWKFDLGGASNSLTTIGSDGTVFATPTLGGIFRAFDESGAIKWSFSTGGNAQFSTPVPSRDGEVVYFSSSDSTGTTNLYALTKSGSLKWKYAPSVRRLTSNSIALSPDGRTIYCPGGGYAGASLYAVDTAGSERWRLDAPAVGNSTITEPAVDNEGNIYFACDQTLYSVDPAGTVRWQIDDLSLVRHDGGPVIGVDGSIYIAGTSIYSIDYSGHVKWSRYIPITDCIPAIDNEGTIYLGTSRAGPDSSNFYAFKPDGSLKFSMVLRSASGGIVDITSRPAISSDGAIFVGCDYPQGRRLFKIR